MGLKVTRSKGFEKSFKKLKDPQIKKAIIKSVSILAEDPYHPSLHTGKIRKVKGVFYSRAGRDARITWEYLDQDTIYLRNCGHHDDALNNP